LVSGRVLEGIAVEFDSFISFLVDGRSCIYGPFTARIWCGGDGGSRPTERMYKYRKSKFKRLRNPGVMLLLPRWIHTHDGAAETLAGVEDVRRKFEFVTGR
jgi:hypothetical protein